MRSVKRYIGRMAGWEERRTGERKDGRLERLKDTDSQTDGQTKGRLVERYVRTKGGWLVEMVSALVGG